MANSWHKNEFCEYLRRTLIPDLKEDGHIETAKDFETALWFMENPLNLFKRGE